MNEDDVSTRHARPTSRSKPSTDTLAEQVRAARAERYKSAKELARGGMGVVEHVFDFPLGRPLALKRIRADAEADQLTRLLVREARVTACLAHPNVVPVHDLDVDDGGELFFTMRLVGGTTLEDWVDGRQLGEPVDWETLLDQLDTMVRICDALGFAHRRGVVHRDIKPSNIMVGQFGEAYLMDWGVARLLEPLPGDGEVDDGELDGIVVGTPSYMPPEQALGMPVDQRSDIFSVGAVLFHILTGRAPYRNDDKSPAIGKARAASAPRPSQLAPWAPPGLESIVVRAMERLPDDRYASILELKSDLVRFIRGGDSFGVQTFEADEAIVRQGEEGDRAYIIESGRVRVEIDGRVIREMSAGEVFGEMAVIESSPRTATVTAIEPTTLRTISADELLGELESMKPWMAALVRSLTSRLRADGGPR